VADRRVTQNLVAVVVALLAACASQPAGPPEAERRKPAAFPEAYYQRLLAQGKQVFRVDAARSLVVIVVRRGGSLAQFGHDHVVASHDMAGYIAPAQERADFYVSLDALVVDEPDLRAEAGFDTRPSAADIAGTRSNMLEKALEASQYPYVLIAVNDRVAGGSAQPLRVTVTLHGTTRSEDAEARIEEDATEVSVTGAMAIDQSRFGIVPFSVLGGTIAVQDRVNIAFRIRARRIE
jgi:hypothetical protein